MASNDSPGRRTAPTPDDPPPTTRERPASERAHADPGRDEKADMPKDDSR
jgi:hypothetical protein